MILEPDWTSQRFAMTEEAVLGLPEHLSRAEAMAKSAGLLDILMGGGSLELPPLYQIQDGAALVNVQGPLLRNPPDWAVAVGAASSYERLASAVEAAMADPAVSRVALMIDSPGGSVDGCQECAARIAAQAGVKPLAAYGEGRMTSGAYWQAAATGQVFAAPSCRVGSIGVIGVHQDISGRLAAAGVRTTVLTAGAYKAVGHPFGPLSRSDESVIQDSLNHDYAAFTADVARYMGLSKDTAQAWAEGRVFPAPLAVQAGLLAGVMGRDEFLNTFRRSTTMNKTFPPFPAAAPAVQALPAGAQAALPAPPHPAPASADPAAVRAEAQANLLGLVAVALGPEAASRVRALAEAGVTPAQAQAMAQIMAQAAPGTPEGVTPQSGAAPAASTVPQASAAHLAALRRLDPKINPGAPAPAASGANSYTDFVAAHVQSQKRGV